jgi:hypothetical protein
LNLPKIGKQYFSVKDLISLFSRLIEISKCPREIKTIFFMTVTQRKRRNCAKKISFSPRQKNFDENSVWVYNKEEIEYSQINARIEFGQNGRAGFI